MDSNTAAARGPQLRPLGLPWWFALIGLGTTMVGAMVPAFGAIALAGGNEQQMPVWLTRLLPIQYLSMFVLGVVLVLALRKSPRAREVAIHPMRRPQDWIIAALAAALFVGISQLGALLLPDIKEAGQQVSRQISMGQDSMLDMIVVFSGTVAAPLGEDMAYRGLMFLPLFVALDRLSWMPRWAALLIPALITSIMFAVSHGGEGQSRQVVFLTLYGLIACAVMWWTGSLTAAMVAHAFTNAINFTIMAVSAKVTNPLVYALALVSPLVVYGIMHGTRRLLGAEQRTA